MVESERRAESVAVGTRMRKDSNGGSRVKKLSCLGYVVRIESHFHETLRTGKINTLSYDVG